MPESQPDRSPEVGPSDWGYDEAHDGVRRSQDPKPHQHRPTEVVTETSDHVQDYSYDLAHDLPPARR